MAAAAISVIVMVTTQIMVVAAQVAASLGRRHVTQQGVLHRRLPVPAVAFSQDYKISSMEMSANSSKARSAIGAEVAAAAAITALEVSSAITRDRSKIIDEADYSAKTPAAAATTINNKLREQDKKLMADFLSLVMENQHSSSHLVLLQTRHRNMDGS